jgi:hypothetical protein
MGLSSGRSIFGKAVVKSEEIVYPEFPALGKNDEYYGRVAHHAEKEKDPYTHAAYKVAQYLTLAKAAKNWTQKIRCYRHALEKHAVPHGAVDPSSAGFFEKLQDWVRRECGEDALRLASEEDEFYAQRLLAHKEPRFKIVNEAAHFFPPMVPETCPMWFFKEDYEALRLLQLQWA